MSEIFLNFELTTDFYYLSEVIVKDKLLSLITYNKIEYVPNYVVCDVISIRKMLQIYE